MSNKHNRGLMSDTIIDETTISEDTVEESTVEREEVSEEIVEEPIEQPSEKLRGIVRCINLNVRKEPNLDSTKIGCLKTGDEIIIDPSKSTDRWYKVSTDSGLDGYCVKEFIDFEQ